MNAPGAHTTAATAEADLGRWSEVLDQLEDLADAGGAIVEPSLEGLPILPPEMEGRAREVLARLRAATDDVVRQMGALRAEMTTARSQTAVATSHALDVEA